MQIDLIVDDRCAAACEEMLADVLSIPSASAAPERGYLVPTCFETDRAEIRVFRLSRSPGGLLSFLRRSKQPKPAPRVPVIECTEASKFREFLVDRQVETISGVSECSAGIEYFTFTCGNGSDYEVRQSHINLPYLQALHLGFC